MRVLHNELDTLLSDIAVKPTMTVSEIVGGLRSL